MKAVQDLGLRTPPGKELVLECQVYCAFSAGQHEPTTLRYRNCPLRVIRPSNATGSTCLPEGSRRAVARRKPGESQKVVVPAIEDSVLDSVESVLGKRCTVLFWLQSVQTRRTEIHEGGTGREDDVSVNDRNRRARISRKSCSIT
jgi:hypothetical protein